jgi:nucleoside-diphosphate-sugar epimerase
MAIRYGLFEGIAMRYFVTGGAGFIGSHLVDSVLRESGQVIVYDNFDEFYQGKERNLNEHKSNQRMTLLRKDILEFKPLVDSMKGSDCVLHLAGQPGVRYSLQNPAKTTLVNVVGTVNVLEAARMSDPSVIIFASSSSVYGVQKVTPVEEEAPTRPLSVYGASKLAAEHCCDCYRQLYGLPIVVLRFHTAYGPRQRPDMAIAKWFRVLKEGERPVIYGDGSQRRDFTYVEDIVRGILTAVHRKEAIGEKINLGSGMPVRISDVIALIGRAMNIEPNPIFEKPRSDEPPETFADLKKARRLLGYEPKVSIEHGIQLYNSWYRPQ